MLAPSESKYFNNIVNWICSLLKVAVPIVPLEHRIFMDVKNDEEILGCCHKIRSDSGELVKYVITIDEPYIRACYYGRQSKYSPYSDTMLIETICHEIAHLIVWNHEKEHSQLTKELYETILNSQLQ